MLKVLDNVLASAVVVQGSAHLCGPSLVCLGWALLSSGEVISGDMGHQLTCSLPLMSCISVVNLSETKQMPCLAAAVAYTPTEKLDKARW